MVKCFSLALAKTHPESEQINYIWPKQLNSYQQQQVKQQAEQVVNIFHQIQLKAQWPENLQAKVFSSLCQFHAAQKAVWGKVISHSGFYDVRNNQVGLLFSGDTSQLLAATRHELVHVLLRQSYPNAPLWLHEGLAEIAEQPQSSDVSLEMGFQEWLGEMATFSAEQPNRLKMAIAGTEVLLELQSEEDSIISSFASGITLSKDKLNLLTIKWNKYL